MNHPVSEQTLKRFAEGTSSRGESRSVVSHLLKGCPDCAGRVRSYLRPEIPADTYDGIFDRLMGPRLERLEKGAAKEARLLPFQRPPKAAPPRLRTRSRAGR